MQWHIQQQRYNGSGICSDDYNDRAPSNAACVGVSGGPSGGPSVVAFSFPNLDDNGLDDELFKKKLTYPYKVFTLNNFQEPLNLTKEDLWSTLKQTTPPDEERNRTQKILKNMI